MWEPALPSFSVIARLALRARKGARRRPGAGAQEVFPVGDRSKNKRGLEICPRSSGFEYHLTLCKHGPAFVARGGPRTAEAGPGSHGCDTSAAPDTVPKLHLGTLPRPFMLSLLADKLVALVTVTRVVPFLVLNAASFWQRTLLSAS